MICFKFGLCLDLPFEFEPLYASNSPVRFRGKIARLLATFVCDNHRAEKL
jgi:hypothetical protein